MQPGDLAHFCFIESPVGLYVGVPERYSGYTGREPRIMLRKDANGASVVYLGDLWIGTGRFYKVLYNGAIGVIHSRYVWKTKLGD